jgi:hypothetical protein
MVTFITFAFCEKEGIVGVTDLELLGDDSFGARSGLFEEELDCCSENNASISS